MTDPPPPSHAPDQQRATWNQLQAVIENIDEGLVVADASGAIVTINQRARMMIGLHPEDEAQRHISEFPRYLQIFALDGRELRPEERPMARVMAGERFSDYEVRCRQVRTGHEWVASFVGTPLVDDDGKVVLAVLSGRDITERTRAEEELREAARQKDAFLATLAHELRNPLAPILTAAQVLDRDAGDERSRRLTQIIGRQVRHLERIVDDLLDVSRITSGRIVLRREVIDLVELVRETVEGHRPGFEEAGVALSLEAPHHPIWVDGDPTRLAQILENLLSNALKFTDAGGSVSVALDAPDRAKSATVRVRDTGIGIDPALQRTLWDPFSQGERAPRHGSRGLGLGTTLVRRLAELHGGDVSAASQGIGHGSEFVVSLPTTAPLERHVPAHDDVADWGTMPTDVLVVEDNADVAAALVEALEHSGCEVRVAGDGREALRLAGQWRPGAILCDIALPGGMDGYQLARALREAGYEGRLVAVTGYGRDEDRELAAEAGFDRHLTKPVSLESIENALTSGRMAASG